MDDNARLNSTYSEIYKGLTDLREIFHISGSIDDSNAKLDEVSKLFTAYLSFLENRISSFPDENSPTLVEELQEAFKKTAALPEYSNQDGSSIFGESPRLIFKKSEQELAKSVTQVVKTSVDAAISLRDQGLAFDLLNEAFGHFIRDNFRGNVEDAQYMTPPEVVEFMAELALRDMERETGKVTDGKSDIVIMDSTCGVGSFLTSAFSQAKKMKMVNPNRLTIVGQDKVERMVRLTKINLSLFSAGRALTFIGNSLDDSSPISEYAGRVDVILTNPPFGARIPGQFIKASGSKFLPFLSRLSTGKNVIDSEILFVEKNLELLRPGGRLLIVVPDGVVSARGIAETLRHHLHSRVQIRAIFDLPSDAFAQAGTRTKTAMMYLVKSEPTPKSVTYLGVIQDLGFKVSLKKGVQTKIYQGTNELTEVLPILIDKKSFKDLTIVSSNPSVVAVPQLQLAATGWTPNHYSASRIRIVEEMARDADIELVPLSSLAAFESKNRKAVKPISGGRFISVLHIISEGVLDFQAISTYSPISQGYPVHPGEVLISKINPRIPRVCIVPDLGLPTQCSTEFEILKPLAGLSSASLAFLLQSSNVQTQIQNLTSGTSSSHNRIKTKELEMVMIPVPSKIRAAGKNMAARIKSYEEALKLVEAGLTEIAAIRLQS